MHTLHVGVLHRRAASPVLLPGCYRDWLASMLSQPESDLQQHHEVSPGPLQRRCWLCCTALKEFGSQCKLCQLASYMKNDNPSLRLCKGRVKPEALWMPCRVPGFNGPSGLSWKPKRAAGLIYSQSSGNIVKHMSCPLMSCSCLPASS